MMRSAAPGPSSRSQVRLALGIVRLYPRRWRERYEAEMRAIIEDHGARPRDLADLAWGAVREHWRTPHGPDPAERPVAARWWRGTITLLRRVLVAASAVAIAYPAGWAVGSMTGPASDDASMWLFFALIAVYIPLEVAEFRYRRRAKKTGDIRLRTALRIRAERLSGMAGFGCYLAFAAFNGLTHATPTTMAGWFVAFAMLWTPTLDNVFDFGGRHRQVREASTHYFGARERVKALERELDIFESLGPDHPEMVKRYAELNQLHREMASHAETLRTPYNVLNGPRS